ncbi:M56 family metallopeptidase [Emticicia sp.]|uniref:M56 family metallopeptidase n=1 Tax=Emticicia sp. TaxID=1930953 RepID=UPI003752A2E7
MKKLFEIIPSNLSSALGWTLIHSIWQGIAIVLIFSILYYFSKPSSTRYWLGLGALGLQFLSAIVTFFTVYEPATSLTYSSGNQVFINFLAKTSNLAFTPQKLSVLQQAEFFLQSNLDLFVTFWIIGTSLLLLRLVVGFTYVQKLKVQQVKPISADIQALMDNLLEKIQISATIKLLESARATVPMTIGWLKPIILLPVGIATGLTVKQLEAILAHELAHIKRYDYLVNIFQNFVEILFFFHPVTWFISAKVRDERENCCDDFAVEICGDRMVLAKALTQVASYQQQPRLAMAFGAKRQTFMDRIKRIIGINESKPLSYGNWAAVLGMILVVALGVVYAQKEVKKNDKPLANKQIVEVKKSLDLSVENLVEKKQNIVISDTSALDEVEAEMERLGKEMEKYGKVMEVYGKQMEEKYGKQMEKQGAEIEQIQRKMQLPQKKIQALAIEMQEASLAIQKLEMKYDDGKMPAEAKQKMADLQKKERELQKLMALQEAEMHKIETEMRPFEQKMNSLHSPMDSLGRLMQLQSKPMDSLGKLMEAKGKVLEKLAKEEEIRFKKQVADFADMLFKAGLIKDKKDFEVRLKGEKLLIDLEPQSPAVYEKVWNWINQNWGSRHKNIKEKDLRISVKGDNINFSTQSGFNNYNYNNNDNRSGSLSAPTPPLPQSIVSPTPRVAPTAPRNSYMPTPTPRVAPQPARVSTPLPPKPPKVVKVSAVQSDFNITKEMILNNKGTCSIYVITKKNGETIVKAIPTILNNDKWTAKGLKTGDLVVVESKEKLKDGDNVKVFNAPKIGQVWLTPEQREQEVMGNADAEFERNEEGKNTSIYANPLLLNGQPLDYSSFSIKSKGVLTVMKGKPTSPEAVKIPFRLYLRRNGIFIYEKKSSNSKLTQVEVSEVLALSKVGDQIVINPTEKIDFKAKRIINIML